LSSDLSLQALVERWRHARVGERANTHSYLIELCTALGVEPPRPAGSGYEFEYAVRVVNRDGSETTNFIDLYKRDHFALEAKDYESGTASDLLLRKASGQVRSYVGHLPDERPPYLPSLRHVKSVTLIRAETRHGSQRRVALPARSTGGQWTAKVRSSWC
jgi:hypothetical protein